MDPVCVDGRDAATGHLWVSLDAHDDQLDGDSLMPAIYPTLPCCQCIVPHGKPPQHHDYCWTLRGMGVGADG